MPAAPATHEARSPIPFRERVFALAGHTTYREPAGGRSTEAKPIPADHLIAAALSFGRRGHDDVGPDIAFDWAVGHPAHYQRVCLWLGAQLADVAGHSAGSSRSLGRCRGHLGLVALSAYNALVRGWRCPEAPSGVRADDWQESLLFACLLLEYAAEDALACAGRLQRAG